MGQVKKGQFDVGFAFSYAVSDTNYNRAAVVTNRDNERAVTSSVTLEVEQGITENLGATVSLGYAGVNHFVLNNASVLSVHGLTDLSVGVFYDVFGDTELKQSSRAKNVLSPYIGVKFPMGVIGGAALHGGHYGASNAGVGDDIRTSNGTIAPTIGLSAVFLHESAFRNALHIYFSPELMDNKNGYRPGHTLALAFNSFIKPVKYDDFEFVPVLSLDYVYVTQSRRLNNPIINSGGHTMSITPQLMVNWIPGSNFTKNGMYSIGFQMPINFFNYKYGSDYYNYEGQLAGLWSANLTIMAEYDFF